MAKFEYDMNNIRLKYRRYEISIAQHSLDGDMHVEEIAVKTNDGWEILYHPAPNDADDYIVGIQAAKKYIDTLH